MPKSIWKDEPKHGLVVGNSSLSADVSSGGRMYQRIICNPADFHKELDAMRPAGTAGFTFTVGSVKKKDCALKWTVDEHIYPRYRAHAQLTPDVKVSVYAFSPISLDRIEDMFVPAVITSLTFENTADSACDFDITFEWQSDRRALEDAYTAAASLVQTTNYASAHKGDAFITFAGTDSAALGYTSDRTGVFSLTGAVHLDAQQSKTVDTWFGCFGANHRWRMHCDNTDELDASIYRNLAGYRAGMEKFIAHIPHIGDDRIYLYTRWYIQAAVLLTKSAVTGEVITMGYNELNQRDSFWTSFIHLAFWPELERSIIETSCRWQRWDGKIPTTLLPKIEREFDIDINEYFCLRIARYFNFHGDLDFLRICWPFYQKAVDFVLSRDRDGDALPEQEPPENEENFWADWKDVRGICGRKLAPHFTLLWLAVLKEGAALADRLGDTAVAERYREIYAKASETVNKPFDEGGMWLDDHYTEVWYDGSKMESVLQDQTVGLIYDVVPKDRVALIYQALSRGENDAGIPETYPYREVFDYAPGMYHNGGIWPYLMFCDILGRFRHGYADDAERLIKKVGYYDLELPDDWSPNEYMNGTTGVNHGFEVQGWSSALFGSIYLGAFEPRLIDDKTVEIQVNFPRRDFTTKYVLPKRFGTVTIGRRDGQLFHSDPVNPQYTVRLVERK